MTTQNSRYQQVITRLIVCLGIFLICSSGHVSRLHAAPLSKELDPAAPKATRLYASTVTGSFVSHVRRTYTTAGPGITATTAGGERISVHTSYEGGDWLLGPQRSGMDGKQVTRDSLMVSGLEFNEIGDDQKGRVITAILKDGKYAYNLPEAHVHLQKEYDAFGELIPGSERYELIGEAIYLHGGGKMAYVIRKTGGGYRWEDKYGNWRLYAAGSGRLLAYGTRLWHHHENAVSD